MGRETYVFAAVAEFRRTDRDTVTAVLRHALALATVGIAFVAVARGRGQGRGEEDDAGDEEADLHGCFA